MVEVLHPYYILTTSCSTQTEVVEHRCMKFDFYLLAARFTILNQLGLFKIIYTFF